MDLFSSLYGDLGLPLNSGPTLAGAPASSTPASTSSGFFSGLANLANAGISAYKNFTAPNAAQVASANAKATASSYLPLILISGGILIAVVVLFQLFRRKP